MFLTKISMKLGEAKLYTIDYSDWLQDGETVTGAVTTIDNTTVPPLDITSAILDTNEQVALLFEGGTAGSTYIVSVIATTTITLPGGDVNQTRIDCIEVEIAGGCTE